MSLGLFSLVPPEIISHICSFMSLDDVVALQDTNSVLEMTINNVFFTRMKKCEMLWDDNGVVFTFSGPSLSTRSVSSDSRVWRDVVNQTHRIRSVAISKTDSARNYEIIQECGHAWNVKEIYIALCGPKDIPPKPNQHGYKKLTNFVASQRKTLTSLRLQTDEGCFVHYDLRNGAELHYEHSHNSDIHFQLIYPLFTAMTSSRRGPSDLTLQIDGAEHLEYALQSAFQAALPYGQRDNLNVLRLEFGSKISELPHEELHRVITAFAPYLNTTKQLQHVVCDFTKSSQLDPYSLEKMYTSISEQMLSSHRISLLTPPFRMEEKPVVTSSFGSRRVQQVL